MKKNGTTSVVPLPSCSLGSRSTQHCEAERNSAPFRASKTIAGTGADAYMLLAEKRQAIHLAQAGRLLRLILSYTFCPDLSIQIPKLEPIGAIGAENLPSHSNVEHARFEFPQQNRQFAPMIFFQLKNRAEAAGATSDRCSGHVQRARECEIPDRSIAREA
jgi:hypothetical protein